MKIIEMKGRYYRAKTFLNGQILLSPALPHDQALAWARKYYTNCQEYTSYQGKSLLTEVRILTCGNKTIAIQGDTSGNYGMSICRKTDKYDYEIGRAIALARLFEEESEIPNFVLREEGE